MAEAPKREPAQVLREARRRDSDRKRNKVFRTVDGMRRDGTPITFASVARTAGVSNWLVYADGVRDYIEDARKTQEDQPARDQIVGRIASDRSLHTDLELTREQNRRLRQEISRLTEAVRGRLGEQLELQSSESLRKRIDQLVDANERYKIENSQLSAQLGQIRAELQSAQDDLAAARTSIRRMIREQTDEIAP
jgi:hypothetical protein